MSLSSRLPGSGGEARHERRRLLVAALLLTGVAAVCAPLSAARAQQGDACAAEVQPKKKSPFSRRFGKLMGAAGVAAITGKKASATAAADAAARDVADTAREQAQADIASAASCAGQTPAPVPARASSAQARGYSYPNDIPVPAEAKAAKAAFDEFGKVDCSDCEGGYAYDSWARQAFASELRGEYGGWEKKLGALKAGETISWKGSAANGTIRLLAEEKVGGFDCKRLGYELTRKDGSATREGLICWGRSNQFAGSDSWVEVY